jgi:hypothetical protein
MMESMNQALKLIAFAPVTLSLLAQGNRPSAKLTGFSDSAVYNGDKIARLDITAALEVQLPGIYRLTFDVTAANGKALMGQVSGRLEAGAQSLTVSFDAKPIVGLAQDGPYWISNAKVFLQRENADATYAGGLMDGGMTAAYRLGDFQRDLYSFTGEIEAAGVDSTPDGKFRALRVSAGVVTPGGFCSLGGNLSSLTGADIDLENADRSQQVPPGKSTLTIDFQGAQIARSGAGGPLIVSDLRLSCEGKPIDKPFVEDTRRHRTTVFRASDFDNPDPDFEFGMPEPVRVAAGDPIPVRVKIRMIGALKVPIQLTALADAPLQVHMLDKWMGQASPSRWKEGGSVGLALTAPASRNYPAERSPATPPFGNEQVAGLLECINSPATAVSLVVGFATSPGGL